MKKIVTIKFDVLNQIYENIAKLEKENAELKAQQKECKLVDGYNCSLCGASQADIRKKYSNYCYHCGAKIIELKGEKNE